MKTNIILTYFIFFLATQSYGKDAVEMFTQHMLQSGRDVWFPESGAPSGGYLLRGKIDLEGNGVDSVFLTSSLDIDRKGGFWTVYRKNNSGEYELLIESYYIGGGLRMIEQNGLRKFSFHVPQKRKDGGDFFGVFWLDKNGAWHDETRVPTEYETMLVSWENNPFKNTDGTIDQEKVSEKLGMGSYFSFPLEKILLSNYIKNPLAQWKGINRKYMLYQQHLDPDDAADIKAIAVNKAATPDKTKPESEDHYSSNAGDKQTNIHNLSKDSPTAEGVIQDHNLLIWFFAVLTAFGGMFWLLHKPTKIP